MHRLIVFDLDGTLIDSRRDIADAANALLEACGAARLAEDQIGRMVGDGAATLVARAFTAAGAQAPPDALDRFLAIYHDRLLVHTRAYDGIPDVLAALSARADIAVLTNKPLAPTRDILRGLDLARFFGPDRVIGGDGPWPRKPDPSAMRHLISLARVDPSVAVLVGDSPIDARTAHAAGCGFRAARYGFGYEGFARDAIDAGSLAADSPADLLSL